jgi:hypothetical protein
MYARALVLSLRPGKVTIIFPTVRFQGAREPVSKSPLIRRFPEDVQAVEAEVVEALIVVDVVESKVLDVVDVVEFIALVVAKAVGEAAMVVLVTE